MRSRHGAGFIVRGSRLQTGTVRSKLVDFRFSVWGPGFTGVEPMAKESKNAILRDPACKRPCMERNARKLS